MTISSDKRSQLQNENSKRNFYMSLFKIYWDLPFDTCMTNFTKIYNDVFSYEKPQNV